jgi:lysozyme family protein
VIFQLKYKINIMADYKHAIAKVLLTEGGYVNDSTDAGGETYKGIARNFWPKWTGWAVIDAAKRSPDFPANLKPRNILGDAVMNFYHTNFWDKVGGDQIASQTIADMLVDSAVNEGIKPAVKRAQVIVGLAQSGIVDSELVKRLNSMI